MSPPSSVDVDGVGRKRRNQRLRAVSMTISEVLTPLTGLEEGEDRMQSH